MDPKDTWKCEMKICLVFRFQDIQAGTEEFFTNLQEMWPNMPILHWWKNKGLKVSDNCWKIPNILNLHYSNKYWQVKRTSEGIIYLYAAYFDIRKVFRLHHKSKSLK